MTSVLPKLCFGLLIILGAVASAGEPKQETSAPKDKVSIKSSLERVMYFPIDELKWSDAGPNLPPGTKIAFLDGDPAKPDQLYTYRLKMPAGARLRPHAHSAADEHVTIISGELLSGLGENWDDKAMKRMPAGSFYALPAGTHHYALVTKECVMQMHGVGPWEIHYASPDEKPPRRAER
jgi:quercetin dioxygenase-like cupin family protein